VSGYGRVRENIAMLLCVIVDIEIVEVFGVYDVVGWLSW
jgi:hypothetical protein